MDGKLLPRLCPVVLSAVRPIDGRERAPPPILLNLHPIGAEIHFINVCLRLRGIVVAESHFRLHFATYLDDTDERGQKEEERKVVTATRRGGERSRVAQNGQQASSLEVHIKRMFRACCSVRQRSLPGI